MKTRRGEIDPEIVSVGKRENLASPVAIEMVRLSEQRLTIRRHVIHPVKVEMSVVVAISDFLEPSRQTAWANSSKAPDFDSTRTEARLASFDRC
jgi:hypothetical protein